jgi:hypothetical protein
MKIRQKKTSRPVDGIKIGAVIALLTTLTGCVGYVDGGYGGGAVVVGGPDLYLFGGGYDRGRDVHGYSDRGAASRGDGHSGGGHDGGRR